MMQQIKIMSKLELANIFSLNVIRHTKDKKAKKTSIALAVTLAVVIIIVMFYCGAMSYGYIKLGAGEIVPGYFVLISSVFILLFCSFKAGKLLFREGCYDILASMPISKSALVISRYIRLYVEGLAVALVVMVPGVSVYVAIVKPEIVATLMGVLSILLVPIIPVTISVIFGVLITGISSRMKNKAIFETLVAILFVVSVFSLTAAIPTTEVGEVDINKMGDMTKELFESMGNVYPPIAWFGQGLAEGNIGYFLIGAIVSVALLTAVVVITVYNFEGINRRLHITIAKHNFKLGTLQNKSVMKALVTREANRYFSSGTYVTNTIMGPVMAVIFAVSLLFIDMEEAFKGFPITIDVNGVVHILFAAILVMNSPIVTSVSMEGKELWIVKSLPVSSQDILRAKLMFSLILLAPFYLVGEVIILIAIKPSLSYAIWMLMLPIALILFALVLGLAVNLKFPKLKWDNDVEVVKQSASALIGGFAGMLIALVSAVPLLFVSMNYYSWVSCVETVVVVIFVLMIYSKISRFNFNTID